MLYRSLFPRDFLSELERLQSEARHNLDISPSIRGFTRGSFPAINIGSTPKSVEIYAFAPGIDPASVDLQLDKGVLTIAGERRSIQPPPEAEATAHIDERFRGRFRRVVTLPDDIDANAIEAKYREGVLQISIQRREASRPRRIAIC